MKEKPLSEISNFQTCPEKIEIHAGAKGFNRNFPTSRISSACPAKKSLKKPTDINGFL